MAFYKVELIVETLNGLDKNFNSTELGDRIASLIEIKEDDLTITCFTCNKMEQ